TRVQNAKIDPKLRETVFPRLEDARVSEGIVVIPLRIPRVDDKPVGHGRGPYTRRVAAAAFFDLDRTLLRRSSALALAGSFRDRGLISRTQLAKAAAWQLLFVLRGAGHEAVRRAAEDGLVLLRGLTPEEMSGLVAEAMEP